MFFATYSGLSMANAGLMLCSLRVIVDTTSSINLKQTVTDDLEIVFMWLNINNLYSRHLGQIHTTLPQNAATNAEY